MKSCWEFPDEYEYRRKWRNALMLCSSSQGLKSSRDGSLSDLVAYETFVLCMYWYWLNPELCQRCYHTRLLVCQSKDLYWMFVDAVKEARPRKYIYIWRATFIHCAALTQTEVIVHQTFCTKSCPVLDCSHRWSRVTFDDYRCMHDFIYCNDYWCINVICLFERGKIIVPRCYVVHARLVLRLLYIFHIGWFVFCVPTLITCTIIMLRTLLLCNYFQLDGCFEYWCSYCK